MNIQFQDLVGTVGVGLILVAYLFQTMGWLTHRQRTFFLLNTIGAGLACYASWLILYWPFVVLEGTWFLVSAIALIRTFKKR